LSLCNRLKHLAELVEHLGVGRDVRQRLGEEAVEAGEPVQRVAQFLQDVGSESAGNVGAPALPVGR
jgi:hypothetical protein